jgi:hypothetical protein
MCQPIINAGEDRIGSLLPDGQSGGGVAAADLGFNGIEITDESHAFLGNGRRAGAGDLDQLAPRMGPAISQLDTGAGTVGNDQSVVSCMAIDLQDTAKALQYPFGMLPAPAGGICKRHPRRRLAVPRSVIAGERPEVPGLGLSRPRIEDRGAGLVHEQLRGLFQICQQRVMDGAKLKGRAADPVCEGRPVQIDALAAVDLGLPVERQVVGIFADQHMGDSRLGRHAARNEPRGRPCQY